MRRGHIEDCMTTKHTGSKHEDAVCIYEWSVTVRLMNEKDTPALPGSTLLAH